MTLESIIWQSHINAAYYNFSRCIKRCTWRCPSAVEIIVWNSLFIYLLLLWQNCVNCNIIVKNQQIIFWTKYQRSIPSDLTLNSFVSKDYIVMIDYNAITSLSGLLWQIQRRKTVLNHPVMRMLTRNMMRLQLMMLGKFLVIIRYLLYNIMVNVGQIGILILHH